MSVQEESLRLHACGFNCAQSVLAALGSYTGMEKKTALAVSGGFGGGCRCGEICGAVTGAVMAAGLCCRYSTEGDQQTKDAIAALSRELTGAFRERFGALRCEEIKIDTERCNAYIAWMAEQTEEVLTEIKYYQIQERTQHGNLRRTESQRPDRAGHERG